MFTSPNYLLNRFQQPISIDDKITIFEDRVLGWKLYIANHLINGNPTSDGIEPQPQINHSGYATMDIVFSYFEMIAKHENGYANTSSSGRYFKLGIYSVFPELKQHNNVADQILNLLFVGVRCGLYHAGITQGRIEISAYYQYVLGFDPQNISISINPHLLVPKLIEHFRAYIISLRDIKNQNLRKNFEVCYDFFSQ
jgi:hypothetical protein